MSTDPISDMLVQIKNASMAGKQAIVVPFSNIKMEIAKVLLKEGYLKTAVKKGKKVKKVLACDLNLDNGKKIGEISRVSKPSRRVYIGVREIKPVRQGQGRLVISTPKGILTDKEAREANLGGEVLFKIW